MRRELGEMAGQKRSKETRLLVRTGGGCFAVRGTRAPAGVRNVSTVSAPHAHRCSDLRSHAAFFTSPPRSSLVEYVGALSIISRLLLLPISFPLLSYVSAGRPATGGEVNSRLVPSIYSRTRPSADCTKRCRDLLKNYPFR
jgi:hypothetical protein